MVRIAHLNIARMIDDADSATMAPFRAQLAEINAIADAAPRFVWRLQDEAGDATAIQPTADDRLLINLSVWESVEALAAFTYRTGHAGVMAQKGQWFEPHKNAQVVLWPVAAGHIPTIDEAFARLWHYDRYGPTRHAFGFRDRALMADLEKTPSPR
jgi:hypothetical protein